MKSATLIIPTILISIFLLAFMPVQTADSDHHNKIVKLASDADNLSTLVTAIKAAGLVETLNGEGPFTVFAPTNEAFASLPEGTLESLLKPENKDKLTSILTYHVVPGKVTSDALKDGMTAATAEGSDIMISLGDNVKINEATVLKADIQASNGVIHIIDSVIMPPEDSPDSSY
ncbi:fasciclin domain-containing protein [Aliifodinibius sp. S!AR15-10]|uniref:fasciclin domain-containing protein n=1 Tax=Aliifodinibius sp. S!AR15-10 TaxID=2950437 RepID=UPI00285F1128|nr:fasciclin domain-containing protein [Aliifodinibius sp. S!AR15-10]MDR8389568.1 fasciclin domain-containing protein [Aliifodinibius sp. S!AR15-10]